MCYWYSSHFKHNILNTITFFIIGLFAISPALGAEDQEIDFEDLLKMDIEDILSMDVSVASKKTESQAEAPAVVATVSQEEMTLYGDRTLHQVLQRQTSVYTRGSYMYPNNLASFRGNMPTHLDTHTLILFNGRPIRESAWGGFNFPAYMTFPIDSLESLEIIRGPGSALYGTNAFSGVINLKSKAIPDQQESSISGQTGSHGTYTADISTAGRYDELGYTTTVRTAGEQGYNYAMTDGTGTYDSYSTRYNSVSGAGRLEYKRFSLDIFTTNMETFHLGILPFWSVPTHEMRVNRLFCNAGYKQPINEISHLEFNLTYNLQEADFSGFPTGKVDINTSDVMGEVTLFYNPIQRLNLTLGYLVEHQQKFSGGDGDYASIPNYSSSPQSAYTQADYRLNQSIKLIGGGQWNRAGNKKTDIVTRIGAVFTPSDTWGIKLMRAEAFRAPAALETTVYDIPVLVGNEDLSPENITTYDAQIYIRKHNTYAALTYFNSTLENLVIRDTSVSPTSFKNGGEQKFQGVELEAKYFVTNQWHILGSYTHQENKQSNDLNYSTAPDDMLKLGTGLTWDWGTAAVFMNYFSKPPRLATEVVRNPEPSALTLISANFRVDPYQWTHLPKGKMQMELKLENLLDEDIYVTEFNRGGNPNSLPDGAGFSVFFGLNMKF